MTITSFYYFLVYQKLKFSVHQWNSTCLAKGLIFYQWRHCQWDASLRWTLPRILPGLPRGRNQQSVCTSIIWAFQQECCSMHHPRRNSNICNCCSLRLIQRHCQYGECVIPLAVCISRRCFDRNFYYKGRSIQIIHCANIHPARGKCQGTFHTTVDDDHHHGSFVGQYCQGQAQEITVEVILCKYSRRFNRPLALRRFHIAVCSDVFM